MKSEWRDYLVSLGFADPLLERAEEVVHFFTDIVRIKPTRLFVSEYRDNDGPVFNSLWLFSEDLICEAKDFFQQDRFDCIPLRNSMTGWEIVARNFDWISANESSRVTLTITFKHEVYGILQASGQNCLALVELLRSYIVPNLPPQEVRS